MKNVLTAEIKPAEPVKAFVGNDGIYVPCSCDHRYHQMLISKELFVEAYNKWIKSSTYGFIGEDNADCWSED